MPVTPEPEHDPRPRNGGTRPVPDPTVLTTQLVDKAIEAERHRSEALMEVLRERLNGIDKATDLRLQVFDHLPAMMDEKTARLEDLVAEKFASISQQFVERDERTLTVSGLNKVALDAAFAAQKEAASEQNKSNTLAITKSETATTETINKLSELFKTTNEGLSDKIDDLKSRVGAIDATMVGFIQNAAGGTSATAETRATTAASQAQAAAQRQIITVGISAILLIIAVVGFLIALQAKP